MDNIYGEQKPRDLERLHQAQQSKDPKNLVPESPEPDPNVPPYHIPINNVCEPKLSEIIFKLVSLANTDQERTIIVFFCIDSIPEYRLFNGKYNTNDILATAHKFSEIGHNMNKIDKQKKNINVIGVFRGIFLSEMIPLLKFDFKKAFTSNIMKYPIDHSRVDSTFEEEFREYLNTYFDISDPVLSQNLTEISFMRGMYFMNRLKELNINNVEII